MQINPDFGARIPRDFCCMVDVGVSLLELQLHRLIYSDDRDSKRGLDFGRGSK